MNVFRYREIALAVFAFVLGGIATGALAAAGHNPLQVVNGDEWLTSNADYGPSSWFSLDAARPAFGLQLAQRNDLPFDRGTAGATLWVHNPGCSDEFKGFANPCGWQLGLAVTQYRSVVVGGQAMEIDGLDAPTPYARVINSTIDGMHVAGLSTNAFADFSGVDNPSASSWFSGFEVNHDAFAVRREAAGSGRFADLLSIDRKGDATVAGSVAAAQSQQRASGQWATRARLVNGTYTFRYARAYAQPPVCVATPEGTARVRVTPAADACVVTSENPNDRSTVDIVVIGNPN